MTEDMKSSSVTTGNCRATLESVAGGGTMHCTTESQSLQSPPAPQQSSSSSLLPDASRCNRLKDFANSEFVNRLLAATRITDFYSAAPHSFFYSEMLRSLVQSRSESAAADCDSQLASAPYSALAFSSLNHQQQQQHQQNHRRSNNRKRLWPNRFSDLHLRATNGSGGESHHDNPPLIADGELKLEKCRKREEKEEYTPEKEQKAKSTSVGVPEKAIPSLMFPTTNPTAPWYTSPYPPPPFFIDLRVSGHIYDNESKPKVSTAAIGLDRQGSGSAFTVPQSRNAMAPMNLTTNQGELPTFKDKRQDDGNNNKSPEEGFVGGRYEPPDEDAEDTKRQRSSSYSRMRLDVEEVIAVDDNDS